MEKIQMIPVKEFCIHHEVELSFIYSLNESGLITMHRVEEEVFIPDDEISKLEMLVRWYREMDINIEGIEAITYLLQRINAMQQKIQILNSRLSIYESE